MKLYPFFFIVIGVLFLGGCNKHTLPNTITKENVPPASDSGTTSTTTPTDVPVTNQAKAEEILNSMSLEEKVGQMFFVCLQKETVLDDIDTYHPGGLILFGNDFELETRSSIKNTLLEYQNTSKLPLLIGVDEEGGIVNRVSKYPAFRKEPFQSPQELYKNGGFDLIKQDTLEKSDLLLSLGINVNLAPVCDISTNPDDFIYERTFGKDAEETSKFVETVVTQMKDKKIGVTLKHFPGYGNNVDTHTGIAIDNRSYDSFTNNDFLPFVAGIKAGADSIMVSHNIATCMDEDMPASLSPKVHDVIRNELNFDGVIMTDDLKMGAIKEYAVDNDVAVLAVLAGNDLLITSNYQLQIPNLIKAVQNKEISITQIDKSVTRILLWKLSLGIIQ